MHNWKITGVDTHSSEHKAVVNLINKEILEIPKTEDGKYTNIASINTKDSITKEEIVALSQKANINLNQFNHVKTKGEFYKKLNKIIKKNKKNGFGAKNLSTLDILLLYKGV